MKFATCISGGKSCSSVVVLDETKQLYCGYVTVRCRRVRRTDVVDRIHLRAPLHIRIGKLCMAVTNRSVKSRTVAHHIEYVMHYSVYARTIQRRLQQSGLSTRRPLLGLPLMQNHRRLRH
ncbi:hypothetical protein TNCV_737061 [Trichonephila clavipes]|nr:hypothetical protein TNCV_737061 [Trichonephila clavipes]